MRGLVLRVMLDYKRQIDHAYDLSLGEWSTITDESDVALLDLAPLESFTNYNQDRGASEWQVRILSW